MGVNSLSKTVTCDLNPGPSAPETSTLITRLPSHPIACRLPINKLHRAAVSVHTVHRASSEAN